MEGKVEIRVEVVVVEGRVEVGFKIEVGSRTEVEVEFEVVLEGIVEVRVKV